MTIQAVMSPSNADSLLRSAYRCWCSVHPALGSPHNIFLRPLYELEIENDAWASTLQLLFTSMLEFISSELGSYAYL